MQSKKLLPPPIKATVRCSSAGLALLLCISAHAQATQSTTTSAAESESRVGPRKTIGGPPLALAKEAADAAIAKCHANDVGISVVVMNEGGVIKLVEIADDAMGGGPGIAEKKAFTVLTYKSDGLQLFTRIESDKELAGKIAAEPDKFWPRPGGARLIKSRDRILGAIGVSGSPSLAPNGPTGGERDDACAAAGLATIQDRLDALPLSSAPRA